MQICVLGRQPEIGLAELEALYGANAVEPFGGSYALVDATINFTRLGSSIKSGNVVADIPRLAPQKIFAEAAKLLPPILRDLPAEGKIKLGLSVDGVRINPRDINTEALKLKKLLRQKYGRSVRAIPNDTPMLSSAQTYHNQLTSPLGIELLIVHTPARTIIARITHVQDIDSYRIRDRDRPKRDAFVGMLPPKLAQTIINLATAQNQPNDDFVVLDPFCGTGVVLQEALLMGYSAYGTDLSEKMIDFSAKNLDWLTQHQRFNASKNVRLEQADATDHIWRQPISAVACEGYLGQPLGGQDPTPERLKKVMDECDQIATGFFTNIASQLTSGTRLAVALPAWMVGGTTHHLSVTHSIEQFGFTRVQFRHAEQLLYHRADQTTAREIIVLEKA